MLVWERVRNYLDERGMKQTVLAQKTDINYATLSAILNGQRTMHAEDLRKICFALQVSPEVFIGWGENGI